MRLWHLLLLFLAAALAVPPVAAQETSAHLILRVMRSDRGTLLGYEVHHDEHKRTYVAMVSPVAATRWACQLGEDDMLEVVDRMV